MTKQIQVQCPPEVALIIVESLRWFVETNYPRGADECSIAAREALLGLADRFERELVQDGRSTYSSRVRAFLCEAVRSYLALQETETGCCHEHRRQVVIDVCRGNSDGAGFEAARMDDALARPG